MLILYIVFTEACGLDCSKDSSEFHIDADQQNCLIGLFEKEKNYFRKKVNTRCKYSDMDTSQNPSPSIGPEPWDVWIFKKQSRQAGDLTVSLIATEGVIPRHPPSFIHPQRPIAIG